MNPPRPAEPGLDDRQLMMVFLLAAVTLTLAEYLFIPIRFPGLFPQLTRSFAPGIWYGSADRAMVAGEVGTWWGPLLPFLWWSAGLLVAWVAAPMALAKRLGFSAADLGWSVQGLRSKLWVYGVLLIPVLVGVVWAAGRPGFLATYPMLRPESLIHRSWVLLLAYWCLYAIQFLSVEFFFRGFLLFTLEGRLGRAAIGVMVVPYCMIHFHKPLPEVFGAILAGVVLGWLALETRSLWGGALLHIAVALSMDVAALTASPGQLPTTWWP